MYMLVRNTWPPAWSLTMGPRPHTTRRRTSLPWSRSRRRSLCSTDMRPSREWSERTRLRARWSTRLTQHFRIFYCCIYIIFKSREKTFLTWSLYILMSVGVFSEKTMRSTCYWTSIIKSVPFGFTIVKWLLNGFQWAKAKIDLTFPWFSRKVLVVRSATSQASSGGYP